MITKIFHMSDYNAFERELNEWLTELDEDGYDSQVYYSTSVLKDEFEYIVFTALVISKKRSRPSREQVLDIVPHQTCKRLEEKAKIKDNTK